MLLRTRGSSIRSLLRQLSVKVSAKNQTAAKLNSIVSDKAYDVNLVNEPILSYMKGSKELVQLEKALQELQAKTTEIPIVIGGKEIKSENFRYQLIPHRHSHKLSKFYYCDQNILKNAIKTAIDCNAKWEQTDVKKRMQIWENAAELMSKKYRGELVAATMLGQSKTIYQAEIDAAAELIDFMRIHAGFFKELLNYQPISIDSNITKNSVIWRSLGGFVAAISPFNFTAIGGNLAFTPALMGNSILWKPSDTAMLSNWIVFKVMREAGVPDGVVNFVPCDGTLFGDTICQSPHLAGINFTGSAKTFSTIWKLVANNLDKYKTFPRISGECGGKNFHFVHSSADVNAVVACTIRSAFEYSGQKCSACSRLYVPENLWNSSLKKSLCHETSQLLMGDVCDYKTFLGAVIDKTSFERIKTYLEMTKTNPKCSILVGGHVTDKQGYFVSPTIVECKDPQDTLLKEEIFGPVLSVYVYKEKDVNQILDLVDTTTRYALTGAVFATDEKFLREAFVKLRHATGNMYINDKSTGAVVGQQPFGGDRFSGTNDKPGSPFYLTRWGSMLTLKETFVPQTSIYYPYMNLRP